MRQSALATLIALAGGAALVILTWPGAAAADQARPLQRDDLQQLYRPGQPPVLSRPPDPAAPVVMDVEAPSLRAREMFRGAYLRAGSPRLAVFWNRVFSDGLRDMAAGERIVIERTRAKASGGADKAFAERANDGITVRMETRRSDDERDSPISEIGEFLFQAGYLAPLIEEGAHVIDRSAIMRLTDAARRLRDSAVPSDDRQLIETAALKDHADLLIQIALSPSAESKTGTFFHVSILEVKTGRIRASFFHDGTFPEPAKKPEKETWKAVRGGYVKVTEERTERPKLDLERMGRILSERTMMALSRLQS